MTIRFEKMIPLPMLEQDTSGSEVWEAESLLLEQGLSYVVEAPSGRGKTSLLSVIYGIRTDYQGVVFMDDRELVSFTPRDWSLTRKSKLSFIFQGLELFDDLTALENIRLKNNMTAYHTEERITEMARALGIEPFLHRKAGILSFGQQQRVAIIRALCQPFNFLLADECFSHMDHENRLTAYDLIREECEARKAGLILTSLNETGLPNADVSLKL
ncbi:MAG: ATP-binding cassette domain-containing protein [Bacteroidales bacterium]|nr:ATP-binding cassette domain-containing protein [Bacteroidales bacterium]